MFGATGIFKVMYDGNLHPTQLKVWKARALSEMLNHCRELQTPLLTW